MSNPRILTSWKEIANYLGKGVRTVQRWESELQMPVRRPAGGDKHIVMALATELDAWVAASPITRGPGQCCDCREELEQAREEIEMLRSKLQALGEVQEVPPGEVSTQMSSSS